MNTIDTGDHVKHGPTGEEWLVAYVRGDKLCACGWPETVAYLSDCTLVKKATPEERLRLLRSLAQSTGPRASHARETLRTAASVVAAGGEVRRDWDRPGYDVAPMPAASLWERRQGMRMRGGWHWSAWQPCTEAEAQRVTGLQSWQIRQTGECAACGGTGRIACGAGR